MTSLFHRSSVKSNKSNKTDRSSGSGSGISLTHGPGDDVVREDVDEKHKEHYKQEEIANGIEEERQKEIAEGNFIRENKFTEDGAKLSSFGPRESLADAAHHEADRTEEHPHGPDHLNQFHIAEKDLPRKMTPQFRNTAARPTRPDEPNAMDGLSDFHTAGDDTTL